MANAQKKEKTADDYFMLSAVPPAIDSNGVGGSIVTGYYLGFYETEALARAAIAWVHSRNPRWAGHTFQLDPPY